jgi:hypothetical protein
MGVADNSDQGVPAVIMDGNEIQKEEFSNIAQKLAQELIHLESKIEHMRKALFPGFVRSHNQRAFRYSGQGQ